MKKIRITAALALALVLVFGTTVFAATSPTTGIVTVDSQVVSVETVSNQTALQALSDAIATDSASTGLAPIVRSCLYVNAPKNYSDGSSTTVSWIVSGVADGAIVYAYQLVGSTVNRIQGTVKGGKVTFTVKHLPASIAIVEIVKGTSTSLTLPTATVAAGTVATANAAAPAAAPATASAATGGLHQTGESNEVIILAALAGIALVTLAVNKKGLRAE